MQYAASMSEKKVSSLDRVLGRMDSLDPVNLSNLAQRLARERCLFEDIFNMLHEGILLINGEGEIDYANIASCRLLGVKDDGLAGENLWRHVPELKAVLTPEMEHRECCQTGPLFTSEVQTSYPEERVLRIYLSVFKDTTLDLDRRYVVVLTDITGERQSTEDRIDEERISSILLLAASVVHELGNPLNSIGIHLQIIKRRLKRLSGENTDSILSMLSICEEELSRLDGIVKNFLQAIRPKTPDLREVQLGEVLAEVFTFQDRELLDRGIIVDSEVPSDLPVIMADRNQLKQVFFNIIKNAMEAMGKGGVLKVCGYADDDNVYLRFTDTGMGIKAKDVMKLFQPHYTSKTEGSGLGLVIVQRIMRAHGGRIGIESKEGEGTVVSLQFPQKNRRIRMLK